MNDNYFRSKKKNRRKNKKYQRIEENGREINFDKWSLERLYKYYRWLNCDYYYDRFHAFDYYGDFFNYKIRRLVEYINRHSYTKISHRRINKFRDTFGYFIPRMDIYQALEKEIESRENNIDFRQFVLKNPLPYLNELKNHKKCS